MSYNFNPTYDYKLIYIFRISDHEHKGCLKIGDATIHTNKNHTELAPNCHDLNYAARNRIDSYTSTAGIKYELLHTEVAVFTVNNKKNKHYGKLRAFRDHDVHTVLKRSGIENKYFDTERRSNEWFITDLETAKNAIKAVKNEKSSLNNSEKSSNKNPIAFRPEQKEAIEKTVIRFGRDKKMLWNAKMRFGKTLSALEVVKRMNFKKTIIYTHKPAVIKGWQEDYEKIFYDRSDFHFGSKTNGEQLEELVKSNEHFIYFMSLQDLRGSKKVGGKFEKNDEIFDINWDFIIIDEAHEGTKTDLGFNVVKELMNDNTYSLQLSGTPFNLLTDFEQESIYTWDYIMEQEAKTTWDKYHFGDSNPYEELPRMNIFTYHLEKSLPVYIDVEDKAFNFGEFFRLWTGDIKKDGCRLPNGVSIGDFYHEKDIIAFLDLLSKEDKDNNYPFSKEEYREYFRHTLWFIPGVKEASALTKLLRSHHIFKHFDIINVTGDGDEEIDTSKALDEVRRIISPNPENTRTITLSCGRLTTGVSVPEWTAVLMLAGSYSTVASQYLQTIFRVQTPANINGKIKEECYVFDFAPDRTLKMIAESVQLSTRAGAKNVHAEIALSKFLNYCPVISIEKSNMKEFKVSELLQELKKAYAERVVKNGFDDTKIYNDELLQLTEVELEQFEKLSKIVKASKQSKKVDSVDINNEGFSAEQLAEKEQLERKPRRELTEEEKKKLKEYKQKIKNKQAAISILRAISIRMPLLVYGMNIDIDSDVTIDNFADQIDELSWNEFMPKGVTKEIFKQFSKYYDKDIFVAASRRIRYIAKSADELEPTERVMKIASLFATFKNPDKETVLTPWRVVNLHLSSTIGGWDFFDENHINSLNDGPRFVLQDNVTNNVFDKNSKILEINSKTGLYPLYVTYTLYRQQIDDKNEYTFDEKYKIWDDIVKKQVFVICKTEMSKYITKRTLLGYRKGKTNMLAFDDLIMQLREKQDKFIEKILKPSFWNLGGNVNMKFNAVVGNPPYHLEGGSGGSNDSPIYQYFVDASINIKPNFVSIIMPARWSAAGRENLLGDFRKKMLTKYQIKVIDFFTDARDVFKTVEIKGGICFFLSELNYDGQCLYNYHDNMSIYSTIRDLSKFNILIRDPRLAKIVEKVSLCHGDRLYVDSIVSNDTPFGIPSNIRTSTKKVIDVSENKDRRHNIAIYHIENHIRKKEFISCKEITKNKQDIVKYKVFLTGSAGSGNDPQVLGNPILAECNSVCSQSYLYSPFDTNEEAKNFIKYLNTKFFRSLVASIKITQSCTNKVYKFVPLQNFKNNSDINWDLDIEKLDEFLFNKYNYDESDKNFIKEKFKYLK